MKTRIKVKFRKLHKKCKWKSLPHPIGWFFYMRHKHNAYTSTLIHSSHYFYGDELYDDLEIWNGKKAVLLQHTHSNEYMKWQVRTGWVSNFLESAREQLDMMLQGGKGTISRFFISWLTCLMAFSLNDCHGPQ